MIGKKGSYGDLFYIVFIATLFAITAVVCWVAFSKINDNLQANDNIAATSKAILTKSVNNYVTLLDGIFLVVIVVLYLAAIILAFQIDTHPVFFILSIVVFGVLVFITAVMANVFWEFASNAAITTYADDFTIITLVMNNFAQIMTVLGFGLAAVMYARSQQ